MKINCPTRKLKLFGNLEEGDIFRLPTSSLYCMKIKSLNNPQDNTVILNFGTVITTLPDAKVTIGDYELQTYF